MGHGYRTAALALAAVVGLSATAGAAPAPGPREVEEAMLLQPDLRNGLEIYEVCSACHLPEGWGTPDGEFPQLAGQHRNVIIKQLADIRAGNRDSPAMYPFALPEAIGDAQALSDVAAYIQRLKMTPTNGRGRWEPGSSEFERGKKLYTEQCQACHGALGEGSNERFFPRLQGQHYRYMLRQLEWLLDGKRRNGNAAMTEVIKKLSGRERELIVNYVSRIPVDRSLRAPSAEWRNPDFD